MRKQLFGFLWFGLVAVSWPSCGDSSTSNGDGKSQGDDEAQGDGASDDNADDELNDDDGSGADEQISNSPALVADVAADIYDALEAGEDLAPYISEVFAAFDVPTLTEDDVEPDGLADDRIEQGLPVVTPTLVEGMARAYADGVLVSVDDFIAGLVEQGAELRFPYSTTGEELNKETFSIVLLSYSFDIFDEYQEGQALPALVVKLGQERANRQGLAEVDPTWSDGYLDPLQFTLLLFTSMVPYDDLISGDFSLQGVGDFAANKIKDKIASEVGTVVEVPLGKAQAAQVSLCASLLLYGHKMTVKNDPNLLWHERSGVPSLTKVTALLEFMDDYYDNFLAIDRWVLEKFGKCTLPRKGPIEGKPLEWSVSSGLEGHGDYDIAPLATDENGEALASWRTVKEKSPECRWTFTNQRDAVGANIVRASNLVPGWSTLEQIVGFLKDTGNTGDAPLTVLYYDNEADCHPQ